MFKFWLAIIGVIVVVDNIVIAFGPDKFWGFVEASFIPLIFAACGLQMSDEGNITHPDEAPGPQKPDG
jgi:hypothetical protein